MNSGTIAVVEERNTFKIPVTAIILTFNEEKNISDCLTSIVGLVEKIYVVDSGSTDETLEILKQYDAEVIQHPFENYSQQRNWAINNLPVTTEWLLNIDADHRVTPELASELRSIFSTGIAADINGLLASRRTMFMGKWIRYGGHYPTYHAILFRRGFGKCEERLYDQHFKVEGKVEQLKGDVIDLITESLSTFTARHNKWSDLESFEQYQGTLRNNSKLISGSLSGNPIQQRRYLKNMYDRFPLFVRPFIYFFVRYFLRLGFLDGKRGLIFHFLQCFWFRFLVDAKIYELKKNNYPYTTAQD
ncbi:MAG: glycosyl transferase family 2 [Sphingobacteriaceae bacterium]|jgi:glycosyltransferase involved in cell wall biosynthesis|nr:glycosyl transferase family 2 [Sphingobacteriaceae bacterium]